MAEGDLPNWAVALMSGGTAIGGTLAGAVVTYVAQTRMAREARREERRAVAAAVASEIDAYLRVAEARERVARANMLITQLIAGYDVAVNGLGADKGDDAFDPNMPSVYATMLPKLGVLGALAGEVVTLYQFFGAIQATAKAASRGDYNHMPPPERGQFLREELDLYQEQLVAGRRLVGRLRAL